MDEFGDAMTRLRRSIREVCKLQPRLGTCRAAVALALMMISASPAGAQIPVIIFGRVQDAESAAPVARALIVAADETSGVYTDSLGNFAIELRGPGPFVVHAVQDGYEPTTFELPRTARSGVSTLLLRPEIALGQVVEPGDRIRITSDVASGEFLVEEVRRDVLLLRPDSDSALEVTTASLSKLEITRGRAISPLEGLFGGGLFGGLVGGALGMQCTQVHYDCLTGLSQAANTLLGVSIGAVVGLVVSRRSGESWEELQLPHRLYDVPRAAPAVANRVTVLEDVHSDEAVELIVRNKTPGPLTAFAWWEGGGRVALGEVRANEARTFVAARRSPGVALFVYPLSDPGPGATRGAPGPSEFILLSSGDRLEWTVLRSVSGVVDDYVRLPRT